MDSKISMRFYRVERKDESQPEFASCLRQLAAIPTDEERTREIADVVITTTSIDSDGPLISGDLLRTQTTNLPSLVQRGQRPVRLELPEGAGLGHHTAFIFDPVTRMLGYQLTRGSVSMERFNIYVGSICGVGTFSLVPVIKAAELRALSRMKARKFVIKVADPIDLEAVEDDQRNLRDSIAHLQDCMDGAYIRITVGMGRKKGFLESGLLRSTIGWLLEQKAKDRGKIQAVKVEGKNMDDSDADPLNFLRAHIGAEGVISLDGLSPEENFKARLAFMKRAAAENAEALKAFTKV